MKPSEALELHRDAIRKIVAEHRATNPRVFGSVLFGEDTEKSDLDILVDPTDKTTLFDLGAIYHKLHKLLGVEVDILTPKSLPERIRKAILLEAKKV